MYIKTNRGYVANKFPIIGGWQHNRQEGRHCEEIPRGGMQCMQYGNWQDKHAKTVQSNIHIYFLSRVGQKLT